MINWRIIARIFSLILIVEGFLMLLSGAVSYIYSEQGARSFLYSAIISIVTGALVFTPLRNVEKITGKKEGYIIIAGAWLIFSLFGTLPYLLSGSVNNFTDAFFETISGITTTGATIFNDVESLQHGVLFWRSLTQWMGGMAIIFISLYVLPVFRTIYIQLPAGEFAGQTSDKIHPRIRDASMRLISIYAILTLAETLLLALGGIPFFDAICTSLSTLSTGGFTTMNNGITAFATPYVTIILTIFMFLAGINMSFLYFVIRGDARRVAKNSEFLFYTIICGAFIVLVSVILALKPDISTGRSILEGSFHVVSIITTTGFYIQDYHLWGNIILIVFFVLMFTGGTSGSTSGGIKIVRLLLITKNSRQELTRQLHPNAFIPVRLDSKAVPQTTIFNLLVFISLYFLVICTSSFVLSFLDYDILTSFSTSASMLANIGPGLGAFGPFTNFSAMPVFGKWFLAFLMFIGRLELLTVMVLFTRSFYRR